MSAEIEPTSTGKTKRTADRLSKDGKWRSFSRIPHLLQYASSGTYFARIKVRGKIIRQSLDTDVWSTAQLRLLDFLREKQEVNQTDGKQKVSFGEAAELYRKRVESDTAMKKRSKGYRYLCMRKIEATWPGLTKKFLGEITEQGCREWAAALQGELASQYFNNVVGTLRLILDEGIREQAKRGGPKLENPTNELSRARISQKALKLPERDQFKALVSRIAARSSWGPKAANLVEFLAYGGMRLYTEAQWVTWEDKGLVNFSAVTKLGPLLVVGVKLNPIQFRLVAAVKIQPQPPPLLPGR